MISWVCSPYNFNQFEIIKNSDVVFTCNKGFLKSLFNLNKKSFQVNHAFDKRNALVDINKSIDVSFIGSIVCNKNFHLNRFETLFYLSKNLPEMKIFSKLYYKLNFKNLINLKRLLKAYYLSKRLKKPVFGEDYYYNLHKSKIVLNSHLDLDEYSGNMRLFEATGSESLVITNFSEDLNDYFNDDEIVSYHNKNDALEKIKYFINNPQERRRIAANGKKRVLKSFSYEVRIKDINKIILENF